MGAAGADCPAAGEEERNVASSRGKSQGSSGSTGGRRKAESRTSAAGDGGATARARLGASRSRSRAGTRPKAKPDPSIAEPTITADGSTVPASDDALAATNARRALNPDMPRVAWLRTQLQNLETHRRERLTRVFQLTLIAIVFMVFVLQNAEAVPVELLFFSLNIRLIWVIVGCGILGGIAGYVIARPEKSLSSLLPRKDDKANPARAAARR